MSAFVGRAEELGRLVAAGRAASAGEVAAGLGGRGPGAGKRRRPAEAAERVPAGRQVQGGGHEAEPVGERRVTVGLAGAGPACTASDAARARTAGQWRSG